MLLTCVATLVAAFGAQQGAPAPSEPAQIETVSLDFGVYQTDKATVMYRSFTPMIDALQERVSQYLKRPVDIRLTIFRTYDDGIDALCKGTVDFVHFGPAPYILAKERNPNLRLVAMEHDGGEKRFLGVVIVRKDSPIQKLEDLKGKSFCFGDPNSTIGRWLIQAEMVKAGVHSADLSNIKYLERHDQVAAAVDHGDFDAGAVKQSTFQKANVSGNLRVVFSFENVTKPIVARDGLDPAVFEALQKSLFELSDPALFKDLKISGFTRAEDSEYDFVREGMKRARTFENRRGG